MFPPKYRGTFVCNIKPGSEVSGKTGEPHRLGSSNSPPLTAYRSYADAVVVADQASSHPRR